MSSPYSFAYLADIRDGARRMVERTHAHEGDLNELVETAEGVARQAATLTLALTRADINADALGRLCSDQARLSVENAAATVRACAGAREQHVEAHRLYSTISSGPHAMVASRTAAVLVVDDADDVRDLVALLLRDAGFVVRTAVNGLEGLLMAYEMRPDVIVMDLTMPVLSGLEATRLIKATQATRETRVIAYTANRSIPPPLERWFVAIVSKPSPPDVVLAAVQNAVNL